MLPDRTSKNLCFAGSHALLKLCVAVVFLAVVITPFSVSASIPNHLYRIDIRPEKDYTRITMRLASPPRYSLASIPGERLRLVVDDTGGTLFKKFRRYSDKNIGGLVLKRRGNSLLVTFQVSRKAGWRDLTRPDISAITLDVGAQFKSGIPQPSLAGRDKIWKGVEKLVRDFDPPLKSEIPFAPTDRTVLAKLLTEQDQNEFMAAEAALYKGRLTEAEELFTRFASRQGQQIRPLAMYRLGETWYKLQKYGQALSAFREAETLWPGYLELNPGVMFYYGDSIARSGNLTQAKGLLTGLVARLADKAFTPALLVRLGDILTRQGHGSEARAIYLNVAENFKENKASKMAVMRNADSEFLQATPWNYRSLSDAYLNASQMSGDLDMREEAHFKYVLLESLHGEATEALQQVMTFQRKFPKGVYAAVTRNMREVLVAEVYRKTAWDKDAASLVRFVEEHNEYLVSCVEQPGFLQALTKGYSESGRPIELVKLLTTLIDRSWAASVAPDLYSSIIDNADLIGDIATTEKTIRAYLAKFPGNPRAKSMVERLGSLYFAAGQHQKVSDVLIGLLKKGARAEKAESYYQLGRSLWALKSYPSAARAMELYISSGGRSPSLLPDAYFVAGASKEAGGDRKAALKWFDAALKLADNKRSDEFLYRSAQLNLLEGSTGKAKSQFTQIAKSGKDPDWQKLAQQALLSMDQKDLRK